MQHSLYLPIYWMYIYVTFVCEDRLCSRHLIFTMQLLSNCLHSLHELSMFKAHQKCTTSCELEKPLLKYDIQNKMQSHSGCVFFFIYCNLKKRYNCHLWCIWFCGTGGKSWFALSYEIQVISGLWSQATTHFLLFWLQISKMI